MKVCLSKNLLHEAPPLAFPLQRARHQRVENMRPHFLLGGAHGVFRALLPVNESWLRSIVDLLSLVQASLLCVRDK